jgi:hypothetical protein
MEHERVVRIGTVAHIDQSLGRRHRISQLPFKRGGRRPSTAECRFQFRRHACSLIRKQGSKLTDRRAGPVMRLAYWPSAPAAREPQ